MAEAADVAVEPTKDKSCVLKASIHCEGCKRKVKKILTQVQGVNFVDIDTKQQKVTVFGTADPDTLIKKLFKSGKHAQLWPQKASGNSKIEEKLTTEKHSKVAHPQQEANPTSNNVPKVQLPAKITGGGGGSAKKNEEIGCEEKVDVVQETKSEGKKKDEGCSDGGETPQAVEKSNVGGGDEHSCSTTSGKKKKKKGQNSNNRASAVSGPAAPVVTDNHESGPPVDTNQSPPRHHHNLPQHHYYYTPPPQPAYGVSYNTAYPTSSYTASSHYPPPPHSYSYAYAYAYPGQPPLDLDQDHSIPPQPLDSFEMFSDENPNGCNIV
ncbi:hypothetical protein ACJIZ3_001349 [Penstemon smallii]|uniref:HMA domain-containing protein n=1 Tax=Penstemon smallii TaxID=265156 RepID=A0ABD3U538_9LAMI